MLKICLNTSTLRGFELPLQKTVEIAALAGFDALEPWISDLQNHEKSGGSLEDLGAEIRSANMSVQGAIGFFEWIVDDDAKRAAALDVARRDMELVAKIGGKLIAAPPMGAVETSGINLFRAAERYSELCEVGREFGVKPLVEVWGFSQTLSRLGEAAFIAIESGHPDACILADVYHLYKGGSPISGLGLINGAQMPLFHVNDYPDIAPEAIKDADRVFTGDGVAPLREIFGRLQSIGFDGFLSLELFNPSYWNGEPLETARTGLEKLKAVLA